MFFSQLGRYSREGQLFLGALGSTGEDTRCVVDDQTSRFPQLVNCDKVTNMKQKTWNFSQVMSGRKRLSSDLPHLALKKCFLHCETNYELLELIFKETLSSSRPFAFSFLQRQKPVVVSCSSIRISLPPEETLKAKESKLLADEDSHLRHNQLLPPA